MLSKMSIFARKENFTSVNPQTPAAKAKQVWDEREGGLVVQNDNLRKLLACSMGISLLMASGMVYMGTQSSIIPYVVEVDAESGMVRNIGTVASSSSYQADDKVTKFFLSQFLKNMREIPLDQVVYRERIKTTYAYLTNDGAKKLNTFLEASATTFGQHTVQIKIISMLPIEESVTENSSSWQVRWEEDDINRENGDRVITPFSGVISIRHIPSEDEEQLKVNPLGIYIYDFNISRDASAINSTKQGNINN